MAEYMNQTSHGKSADDSTPLAAKLRDATTNALALIGTVSVISWIRTTYEHIRVRRLCLELLRTFPKSAFPGTAPHPSKENDEMRTPRPNLYVLPDTPTHRREPLHDRYPILYTLALTYVGLLAVMAVTIGTLIAVTA